MILGVYFPYTQGQILTEIRSFGNMSYKCFETDRLHLRPTGIDDAAFILTLLNTPKWIKYIGKRNVNSKETAIKYIEDRMLSQLHKLGYGNYTIINKETQAKIGTCGLYDREGLEGIDIGYALLPAYEKLGYAYEASLAIRDAAKVDFGINYLRAITTKDNLSSQKLLEKLQFKYSKIINLPNDPADLMLYDYHHE